jgi:hypothetical protein
MQRDLPLADPSGLSAARSRPLLAVSPSTQTASFVSEPRARQIHALDAWQFVIVGEV